MHRFSHFFRARWVEILITGIWLQSVISALFTGIWWLIAATFVGGLIVVLLVLWGVDRVTGNTSKPRYGDGEAFGLPRRALLFTVGMQDATIRFALDRQQPEWLGLICTRQSWEVGQQIADRSGLDEEHVQIETVDPWSVTEVRSKAHFILEWFRAGGVEPAQAVVDITGGTSIMTAAAFSVACERQIDCQYVRSDYDEHNRVIHGTQRAVYVTRYGQSSEPRAGPTQ